MAAAYIWVSRIFSICGEMVLPGILGYWLDQYWGTKFIAILGFMLGLTLGMVHLIQIANKSNKKPSQRDSTDNQ